VLRHSNEIAFLSGSSIQKISVNFINLARLTARFSIRKYSEMIMKISWHFMEKKEN